MSRASVTRAVYDLTISSRFSAEFTLLQYFFLSSSFHVCSLKFLFLLLLVIFLIYFVMELIYLNVLCTGFVTYKEPEMVDTVQANRPHRIDGVKIETKRAVPRDEVGKGDAGSETVKKIFVGGMKDGIEDKDLEEYFGAFGRVISVEQVRGQGHSLMLLPRVNT